MDLKLDSSGDLELINGNVSLTEGVEVVVQNLRIRLKTFLGEWFLDQRVGLPYFQNILVKNPNLPVIQTILRKAILETEGMDSVTEFNFNFDTATRQLSVSFQGKTKDLDTFIFEFQEFILG